MLIAQISDLHIQTDGKLAYGKVDTVSYLTKAVAVLNELDPQPDIVLATGDLVERGSAVEYGLLREILAPLKAPLLVVPGNHDARATLKAAFPTAGGDRVAEGGFFHYAVDDYPVRLVAVDTSEPKKPWGTFCEERAAWLDATLAAGGAKPTLIFQHHPPFATGIGHMDKMGLRDEGRLAAIVKRYPNVERVVCGHVHRAIQARFAGTIASVCPSTAHQIALDLREASAGGFTFEPPGLQLHRWTAEGGIVSHTLATVGNRATIPFPWG
jgi:3',5'-cyclic AMP phosphodiesterase CpdA